jgi:hypothetical protein
LATDQVYGAWPPAAKSLTPGPVSTGVSTQYCVVTLGRLGCTVIETLVDTLCAMGELESVAVTVRVVVPEVVGVPVMEPVAGARLSPAGRDPEVMDHVTGAVPPVDAKVAPE